MKMCPQEEASLFHEDPCSSKEWGASQPSQRRAGPALAVPVMLEGLHRDKKQEATGQACVGPHGQVEMVLVGSNCICAMACRFSFKEKNHLFFYTLSYFNIFLCILHFKIKTL